MPSSHTANLVVVAVYNLGLVPVSGARILNATERTEAHEWACQLVAFEILRALEVSLLDEEGYNNMSDEDWEQMQEDARAAADFLNSAPVDELSSEDVSNAASYGGNYFEHGHAEIMENQTDVVSFTKLGGIQ